MALNRDLWPGRNAWVSGPPGEESPEGHRQRHEARERALHRRIARRRRVRAFKARVRRLLHGD